MLKVGEYDSKFIKMVAAVVLRKEPYLTAKMLLPCIVIVARSVTRLLPAATLADRSSPPSHLVPYGDRLSTSLVGIYTCNLTNAVRVGVLGVDDAAVGGVWAAA